MCKYVKVNPGSSFVQTLLSLIYQFMLHAKFQDHRTSDQFGKEILKLFTIYGRGVHLGHVTLGIYTNFRSTCEEDA